jgi:hypothetical protein
MKIQRVTTQFLYYYGILPRYKPQYGMRIIGEWPDSL